MYKTCGWQMSPGLAHIYSRLPCSPPCTHQQPLSVAHKHHTRSRKKHSRQWMQASCAVGVFSRSNRSRMHLRAWAPLSVRPLTTKCAAKLYSCMMRHACRPWQYAKPGCGQKRGMIMPSTLSRSAANTKLKSLQAKHRLGVKRRSPDRPHAPKAALHKGHMPAATVKQIWRNMIAT